MISMPGPDRTFRYNKRHWSRVERDMRLVPVTGEWSLLTAGGDKFTLVRRSLHGPCTDSGEGFVSHAYETAWYIDFSYGNPTVALQHTRTVPLTKAFCDPSEKDETVFNTSSPRPMRRKACLGFLRKVHDAISGGEMNFSGDYRATRSFLWECRRKLETMGGLPSAT